MDPTNLSQWQSWLADRVCDGGMRPVPRGIMHPPGQLLLSIDPHHGVAQQLPRGHHRLAPRGQQVVIQYVRKERDDEPSQYQKLEVVDKTGVGFIRSGPFAAAVSCLLTVT
jgi:hypothetical protein